MCLEYTADYTWLPASAYSEYAKENNVPLEVLPLSIIIFSSIVFDIEYMPTV